MALACSEQDGVNVKGNPRHSALLCNSNVGKIRDVINDAVISTRKSTQRLWNGFKKITGPFVCLESSLHKQRRAHHAFIEH